MMNTCTAAVGVTLSDADTAATSLRLQTICEIQISLAIEICMALILSGIV